MALVLCGTFLSWYLLSNIFAYLRGRNSAKNDVKLSELQALVEIAVERAHRPLIDRIEQLEHTVEQQHALPPRKPRELDTDEFLAASEDNDMIGRVRTSQQI